jgi:hypothetical protein
MSNLPTVTDEFGVFDVEDLRLSLRDPHPRGFKDDGPEFRLIDAMVERIEQLQNNACKGDCMIDQHVEILCELQGEKS